MKLYRLSILLVVFLVLQGSVPSIVFGDDSILNQPAPESADKLPSIFDLELEGKEERFVPFKKVIEESTVNLHLRNFYFNRGKPDVHDSIAWAQGGSLEYQTGKVAGVFSVNAEYFGSFRLWGPDDHDGTLLLEPVQENIDVLGVANGRFDLEGNILSLYRQKYDLPYVNQQDNRMLPNTFEGYTIGMPKTANKSFQYIAGYIDRMKKRDSDTFISMSDAAGVSSKENGIFLGGARYYPISDLSIAAIDFYGEDILNIFYSEVVYKSSLSEELKNNLSLQYSDQRTVGDDLLRGDDYSSNFWGIQNALSYKHAVLKAAFNQTDTGALMRTPFGSYPGYTSSIVEDFNRAGEASWLLGISYEFGRLGVKDLSISTNYISGSGAIDEISKDDIADKKEADVTIDYKVSEGTLKGFWVRLRSGTVDEERKDLVQDFRIIVNYEIPLYSPPVDSSATSS